MSHDNIAFHRKHMLPEAPPPVTETGAIKWLRENLFSSIPNGILTVVSAYVVLTIAMAAAPWFFNGVWDSPSLSACREMLDGRTGACFAVLTERWNQLLFGFQYPSRLYWRPTLAFVLLFVAIAPVLFIKYTPRGLLVLTGLYPFIAYWLIWGGSIVVPVVALLGVLFGAFVYRRTMTASAGVAVIAGIVAAMVFWWAAGAVTAGLSGVMALEPVASRDMGGFDDKPDAGRDLRVAVAALRHSAGAWAAIVDADRQVDLRGVHRVHPRCAAYHAAVRGQCGSGLFPAAGHDV